jgi:hypothetical protein
MLVILSGSEPNLFVNEIWAARATYWQMMTARSLSVRIVIRVSFSRGTRKRVIFDS